VIVFRAACREWTDRVDLLILDQSPDGTKAVAKPVELVLERSALGAVIEAPTLSLSQESAQSLMEALWGAGLRPVEAKYPNGEINRLEAHLADMRRLVFEK
jgi:hypothetical protein